MNTSDLLWAATLLLLVGVQAHRTRRKIAVMQQAHRTQLQLLDGDLLTSRTMEAAEQHVRRTENAAAIHIAFMVGSIAAWIIVRIVARYLI